MRATVVLGLVAAVGALDACGSSEDGATGAPTSGGAAGGGGIATGGTSGSGGAAGIASDAASDAAEDGAPDASDAGADPTAALPACAGDVVDLLLATKATMPAKGSNGYVSPSAARRAALGASIAALAGGDATAALAQAKLADYSLCRGTGSIALWRPNVATEGSASLAWRALGARPVILEAPHPLHDSKTLEQAAGLFETLTARAVIASGTHRCASTSASSCSGTTEACSPGTPAPYRASDMAHVVDSLYHAAHVALSEQHPSDWVVGVHGMADPGVSVSDGTTLPTSASSPVAKLAAAIETAFAGTALAATPVTTCNSYPGAVVKEVLCGSTDVQGRHLNGSTTPCMLSAKSSSSRFLHVEQSAPVRDNPSLMAAALDAVVPN